MRRHQPSIVTDGPTDLGRGGGAEDDRVAALHGLREAGGVHRVPDHHLVVRGARRLAQLARGFGAAHEAHGLELCRWSMGLGLVGRSV